MTVSIMNEMESARNPWQGIDNSNDMKDFPSIEGKTQRRSSIRHDNDSREASSPDVPTNEATKHRRTKSRSVGDDDEAFQKGKRRGSGRTREGELPGSSSHGSEKLKMEAKPRGSTEKMKRRGSAHGSSSQAPSLEKFKRRGSGLGNSCHAALERSGEDAIAPDFLESSSQKHRRSKSKDTGNHLNSKKTAENDGSDVKQKRRGSNRTREGKTEDSSLKGKFNRDESFPDSPWGVIDGKAESSKSNFGLNRKAQESILDFPDPDFSDHGDFHVGKLESAEFGSDERNWATSAHTPSVSNGKAHGKMERRNSAPFAMMAVSSSSNHRAPNMIPLSASNHREHKKMIPLSTSNHGGHRRFTGADDDDFKNDFPQQSQQSDEFLHDSFFGDSASDDSDEDEFKKNIRGTRRHLKASKNDAEGFAVVNSGFVMQKVARRSSEPFLTGGDFDDNPAAAESSNRQNSDRSLKSGGTSEHASKIDAKEKNEDRFRHRRPRDFDDEQLLNEIEVMLLEEMTENGKSGSKEKRDGEHRQKKKCSSHGDDKMERHNSSRSMDSRKSYDRQNSSKSLRKHRQNSNSSLKDGKKDQEKKKDHRHKRRNSTNDDTFDGHNSQHSLDNSTRSKRSERSMTKSSSIDALKELEKDTDRSKKSERSMTKSSSSDALKELEKDSDKRKDPEKKKEHRSKDIK